MSHNLLTRAVANTENIIERIPAWIRWILTVPASVLTYFLVNAAGNLLGLIANFVYVSTFNRNFFSHIFGPAIAGYCSIAVVSSLAPGGKHVMALLTAGLWWTVFGALTFISVSTLEWKSLLPVFFSGAGTYWALYNRE